MKTHYIVCSTQRSGSTFYCQCLQQTQVLGIPDEWLVFLEYKIDNIGADQRAIYEAPVDEIIRTLTEQQVRRSNHDVVGWKIMWSTMRKLKNRLNLDPSNNCELAEALHRQMGKPKYIFIERSNKIAQAISNLVMEKTSISHVRSAEELRDLNKMKRTLTINYSEISGMINRILEDEVCFFRYFADNKITPLRVTYEDFCNDVSGGVSEVLGVLGVSTERAQELQGGKLIKTRSDFERDIARDYLTELVRKQEPPLPGS